MQNPGEAPLEASLNGKGAQREVVERHGAGAVADSAPAKRPAEEHESRGKTLHACEKAHELFGPVQFLAWFLEAVLWCPRGGAEQNKALFTTSGPTRGCLRRGCVRDKWDGRKYLHLEVETRVGKPVFESGQEGAAGFVCASNAAVVQAKGGEIHKCAMTLSGGPSAHHCSVEIQSKQQRTQWVTLLDSSTPRRLRTCSDMHSLSVDMEDCSLAASNRDTI